MIEITNLSVSTAFLFKEQTHRGRCIVAYNKHSVELYELNDQELLAFMKDVNAVARAIKAVFNPEKNNYGAYGDKLKHLHVHLVPKYIDGQDFGGTFVMNLQKTYLSDAEYAKLIQQIKTALK
jgi:ATP adenylyltransferase